MVRAPTLDRSEGSPPRPSGILPSFCCSFTVKNCSLLCRVELLYSCTLSLIACMGRTYRALVSKGLKIEAK